RYRIKKKSPAATPGTATPALKTLGFLLQPFNLFLSPFQDFADLCDPGRVVRPASGRTHRRLHQLGSRTHYLRTLRTNPLSPVSGLLGALPDFLHGLGFPVQLLPARVAELISTLARHAVRGHQPL